MDWLKNFVGGKVDEALAPIKSKDLAEAITGALAVAVTCQPKEEQEAYANGALDMLKGIKQLESFQAELPAMFSDYGQRLESIFARGAVKDQIIKELTEVTDPEQKQVALSNVMSIMLADGDLNDQEQAWAEQVKSALGL